MRNHIHLVLHVNEKTVQNWSMHETLERWYRFHKGTLFTQKYVKGDHLQPYELELVQKSCEAYRQRFSDISWFIP